MPVMTTTELTNIIQDRYQEAILNVNQEPFYFWPGMPAHNYIQVDNRVGESGGDLQWGIYNELESHDVDEGVDHVNPQSFTAEFEEVTTQERMVQVALTNKAMRRMTFPNDYQRWADSKLRATLRAQYTRFDELVFGLADDLQQGHANSGNALVYANLLSVVNLLKRHSVPQPWVGFLGTRQWDDLLTEASTPVLDASMTGDSIGGEIWRNYDIRRLLGVNWIITSSVYDDGTDEFGFVMSANQDASPIGAVIEKLPLPLELEYDASARVTEHNSTMDVGTGIIDQHTGADDATGYYIQTRTH